MPAAAPLIDELLHAGWDLSEARGIQAGLGRIIVTSRRCRQTSDASQKK